MKKTLASAVVAAAALTACMPNHEGVQSPEFAPGIPVVVRNAAGQIIQQDGLYDTAFYFPYSENGVRDNRFVRVVVGWNNNGNPWWCYSDKVPTPIPAAGSGQEPNNTLIAFEGHPYNCSHDVTTVRPSDFAGNTEVYAAVLGVYMSING